MLNDLPLLQITVFSGGTLPVWAPPISNTRFLTHAIAGLSPFHQPYTFDSPERDPRVIPTDEFRPGG
jgi:hypothetical protein